MHSCLSWKEDKTGVFFGWKSARQSFRGVDTDKLSSSHWWLRCHVLISPNPSSPPSFLRAVCLLPQDPPRPFFLSFFGSHKIQNLCHVLSSPNLHFILTLLVGLQSTKKQNISKQSSFNQSRLNQVLVGLVRGPSKAEHCQHPWHGRRKGAEKYTMDLSSVIMRHCQCQAQCRRLTWLKSDQIWGIILSQASSLRHTLHYRKSRIIWNRLSRRCRAEYKSVKVQGWLGTERTQPRRKSRRCWCGRKATMWWQLVVVPKWHDKTFGSKINLGSLIGLSRFLIEDSTAKPKRVTLEARICLILSLFRNKQEEPKANILVKDGTDAKGGDQLASSQCTAGTLEGALWGWSILLLLLLLVTDRQVILPRSQWPIPREELHQLVAGAQVRFEPFEDFWSSGIWYLVSGIWYLVSGIWWCDVMLNMHMGNRGSLPNGIW